MLSRNYIRLLSYLISIIDNSNKKKIINFFKKIYFYKSLIIVDVGAHKGETIELFSKNFQVRKIFAFEANSEMFKILKKKFLDKKIIIYNTALGSNNTQKYFNVIKDSSSSTFNEINYESSYYLRKLRYLSFFRKKFHLIDKKILKEIKPLKEFKEIFQFNYIDILKIDTEGYELNILKGLKVEDFKKIKFIYLEHHYDLMIKKDYKFKDLKKFLDSNKFVLKLKIKMKFRKTFEYVYENKNFLS